MADLPAASITCQSRTLMGNFVVWIAKIQGDGTGVTLRAPVGRIVGYWTCSIDDTTIPAPTISYSENQLTYSTTPTNTKYHWLFVIGTE